MDRLLVGSYSTTLPWVNGHGEGLYSFDFQSELGIVDNMKVFKMKEDNPTYFYYHSLSHNIYIIHEISEYNNEKEGALSIVNLNSSNIPDSLINQCGTGGTGPCHVTVSSSGEYVFIANYEGGSISCILHNGDKVELLWKIQHEKNPSLNHFRQDNSHCHCVTLLHDERLLHVVDLGTNSCYMYLIKDKNGEMISSPKLLSTVFLDNEAGPRHIAIHPSLSLFYILNELNNTVSICRYEFDEKEEKCSFKILNSYNTLPEDYNGESFAAAIKLSNNGKFLYASNRGHDSISIFSIDEKGILSLITNESTRGKAPRDFIIHPTKPWIIVLNQDTDNGSVFKIKEDGTLEYTSEFECPTPVCGILIQ